ncbi:MAG: hypothetical protein A2W90_20870 [Bacteroidetes bacterium GWF2_42_66]|nr:MAG: hypothetical protein A2W92_12455 [Bacteroidetes bacterium GWA2_42_15]OFX99195.1 MAG: hypothetical protein A2W89_03550 [Bacteroidetes bacterium GWE2_42_39]OFY40591.1 MAG: hypothetical protein A2W90_20870 [Bacteroidetes bacterium GWF2_42_66]
MPNGGEATGQAPEGKVAGCVGMPAGRVGIVTLLVGIHNRHVGTLDGPVGTVALGGNKKKQTKKKHYDHTGIFGIGEETNRGVFFIHFLKINCYGIKSKNQ